MYLQFYGLREAPFSPTPDPKFLFQSARHREALAQLVYGVRERKGFIVLSGEIGTGKTTLLRTLLERLDDEHPVAYVHNSSLPWEGMLEYILHDWGVKTNDATQAQRLVNLNEFLIEQHRLGHSPVLVIDEAQNLSIESLEAVRLLSNFETTHAKLLQILLVGQPELRDTLNAFELRHHRRRRPAHHRIQSRHPARDQHARRSLPDQRIRRQQAQDRRPHGRGRHRVPRGRRTATLEAPRPGPAHAEPGLGVGGPQRRGRARHRPARHDGLRRHQRGLAALRGRTS